MTLPIARLFTESMILSKSVCASCLLGSGDQTHRGHCRTPIERVPVEEGHRYQHSCGYMEIQVGSHGTTDTTTGGNVCRISWSVQKYIAGCDAMSVDTLVGQEKGLFQCQVIR